MRFQVVAWVVSSCAAVIFAGCGKKVDCNELCNRQAQCVAEIAIVLGSATPEQTARLTPENREALGDRQRDRCRSDCESPTKPSSMHSKWRRCLEIQDCEGFAKCIYR